jgi:DNA-directed RNA polymerase specialized sigma subunit
VATTTPKRERTVSESRGRQVVDSLDLVRSIVNEMRRAYEREYGKAWHTTDEDLVQAGTLGFLEAASVYGPTTPDAKLSAFSYPWIRKAVWLVLDDGRRLPRPVGLMDDDDWSDAA